MAPAAALEMNSVMNVATSETAHMTSSGRGPQTCTTPFARASARPVFSVREGVLGRLAVGEKTSEREDGQHPHGEAEEPGDKRREHVHMQTGPLGVHAADDEVRRRADERADAAHARGVAQGDEEL